MTLPGDRIPEETRPHSSSTPAQDAEVMPVYCRHSVAWEWDADEGGYRCADEDHYGSDDDLPTHPGAIPVECQPYYAHPPQDNAVIQAALDDEDRRAEAAATVEHAQQLAKPLNPLHLP